MKQPENSTGANAHLSPKDYEMMASAGVDAASVQGPVAVDPDVAEAMGAFDENALSLEDAIDSFFDGELPTVKGEPRNG